MRKADLVDVLTLVTVKVEDILEENRKLKQQIKELKYPKPQRPTTVIKATQKVARFLRENADQEFRGHQISEELKITAHPRLRELVRAGYVIETGKDKRGYKYYQWGKKPVPAIGTELF